MKSPTHPLIVHDTNKRSRTTRPMQPFRIIVEKHADGYVAYPVGLRGIVVGDGDTYEDAVADVTSAIRFHIETFGRNDLASDPAQ